MGFAEHNGAKELPVESPRVGNFLQDVGKLIATMSESYSAIRTPRAAVTDYVVWPPSPAENEKARVTNAGESSPRRARAKFPIIVKLLPCIVALAAVHRLSLDSRPRWQPIGTFKDINATNERSFSSDYTYDQGNADEVTDPVSLEGDPSTVLPELQHGPRETAPKSFATKRPEWCEELIRKPHGCPMQNPCHRGRTSELQTNGKPGFFGQLNHDWYLWKHHWSRMSRPGLYLDVAANHAMELSNTYFLDRCLGWSGICVEANPRYFYELSMYRTCSIVPTCVSERDGHVVDFMLYEGLSGISSTNKNAEQLRGGVYGKVRSMQMTCIALSTALGHADVQNIDYMSLDVEGHEQQTLLGINWNTTRISVISLEAPPNSGARSFLEGMGYTRHEPLPGVEKITGDEIYLAPGVVFGQPQ